MPRYDAPNHVVIRDKHITGALSVATAVDSAFVGTTLRTRNKAVIIGCAFRVGSGGSAAGSNSFKVSRINTNGVVSTWQVLTQLISAGASALGKTYDISLVSALTVNSLAEGAVLIGQAASLDKIPVLSDVVWRYRILPGGDDEVSAASMG